MTTGVADGFKSRLRNHQRVAAGVRRGQLEVALVIGMNAPSTAPDGSTRSTSAPGTIAPVGSATTPCMDEAVAGGVEFKGVEAKATAGNTRKRAQAKKRMMRNLQSKHRVKTSQRANDASTQKSVDIDVTRALGHVDANEINIVSLTRRLRAQKT